MGYTLATFNNEVHTMEVFARNPVSCSYVVPPDSCCIEVGACPLNPLPAQYWNYYTREETYTRNYLQKYVADIYTDTRNAARYAAFYDCFLTCTFNCCDEQHAMILVFSGNGCFACGYWNTELSCTDFVWCACSPWYTQFASSSPVWQCDKGFATAMCLSATSAPPLLYSSIANSYMCSALADGTNFMCGVMGTIYAQSLLTDYHKELQYTDYYFSLQCAFGISADYIDSMQTDVPETDKYYALQIVWYCCFNSLATLLVTPFLRNYVQCSPKLVYSNCFTASAKTDCCFFQSSYCFSLFALEHKTDMQCDYWAVFSDICLWMRKCSSSASDVQNVMCYCLPQFTGCFCSCRKDFVLQESSTVSYYYAVCFANTSSLCWEVVACLSCKTPSQQQILYYFPLVCLFFCNHCVQ